MHCSIYLTRLIYFAGTVNAAKGTEEENARGNESASAIGTVSVTKIVSVTGTVTEIAKETVIVIVTAKRNVESTEVGHVRKSVIKIVIVIETGKGERFIVYFDG